MGHRSNKECDDIKNNDLFGMKPKYSLMYEYIIKSSINEDLKCNQMIALYGEWGSGKSSFFKSFKKDNDKVGTIKNKILIFNAWKVENDSDLSASLLDFIVLEFYKNITLNGKKLVNDCKNFFRAFAASSSFDLGVVKFDTKNALDEARLIEKENILEKSFYFQKKKFENSFNVIIDELVFKTSSTQRLTICIDELDRCSPENVINLLTNIKHFYTLNENITFVCGIDREAIKKALNCRYNDIIKADEYLEKIFDISFTIPNMLNTEKLVEAYFTDSDMQKFVIDLLYKLKFNNPRKLKKTLNKYKAYCNMKDFAKNSTNTEIQNIIKFKHDSNNEIQVAFVLYSIILHEFYPEKFNQVYAYEEKLKNILEHETAEISKRTHKSLVEDVIWLLENIWDKIKITRMPKLVNKIYESSTLNQEIALTKQTKNYKLLSMLILIFAPNIKSKITTNAGVYPFVADANELLRIHTDENETNIQIDFCRYLISLGEYDEPLRETGCFNLKELFDATKILL